MKSLPRCIQVLVVVVRRLSAGGADYPAWRGRLIISGSVLHTATPKDAIHARNWSEYCVLTGADRGSCTFMLSGHAFGTLWYEFRKPASGPGNADESGNAILMSLVT